MTTQHGRSSAVIYTLLGIVVVAWGTNWTMTKQIVQDVSPLWATALRCAIAAVVIGILLRLRGQFALPKRGDLPVVCCTALLHMTAYSALIATGLQFVPAGRAIVLGYTTPLWVTIGARMVLGEAISARQAVGVAFGLAGLASILAPLSLDWSDGHAVAGSGMILAGAICWAFNIVYVRAHRWVSTPFQLVFWQLSFAAAVLSILAVVRDGPPPLVWTPQLAALMLFSAVVCTALAHWAMSEVNRALPAVSTSLGLLATPAIGIISGAVILDETLDTSLIAGCVLIVGGIVLGLVRLGDDRAPERV